MTMLLRALAALAFVCAFSVPLEAQQINCPPGASLNDIRQVGEEMVVNGVIEELLLLEGDPLEKYAEALNAGYDAGIPSGLSHIVVAVRLDGSAALFGFTDGCRTGIANLLPGVHREIYGQEVEAPGAGS